MAIHWDQGALKRGELADLEKVVLLLACDGGVVHPLQHGQQLGDEVFPDLS